MASHLNSNERPTHVPCTRSSALSCTRLIGAVPLQTALCAVSACCTLANARRFRRKLSLVLPAFVRRAVPRPPCCPTPSLPPCLPVACPGCRPTPTLPPGRLSWLPRSSAVHPRLPAGPSPPASFVAPSHVNAACGYFLLHERLELLLTCAPGGYDKAITTTTCTGTITTCTSTTATCRRTF